MKQHRIHYLYSEPNAEGVLSHKADELLRQGWKVVSVTPQMVAIEGNEVSSQSCMRGGWCVVLEKDVI